jgi:hypothetical protein
MCAFGDVEKRQNILKLSRQFHAPEKNAKRPGGRRGLAEVYSLRRRLERETPAQTDCFPDSQYPLAPCRFYSRHPGIPCIKKHMSGLSAQCRTRLT